MLTKIYKKARRVYRTRQRIKNSRSDRIRLSIHRTNNHIYAQLINDLSHTTIASASTLLETIKAEISYGGNVAAAQIVGKSIADLALSNGIKNVVFDRGSHLYHGRVKALADAARAGGLNF